MIISPQFGQNITYQDVFSPYEEFSRYGELDTQRSFSLISERAADYFEKVKAMAPPEDVEQYLDNNKIGILEEASDILFEYTLERAIKGEIIDDNIVDFTAHQIIEPMFKLPGEKRRPFLLTGARAACSRMVSRARTETGGLVSPAWHRIRLKIPSIADHGSRSSSHHLKTLRTE